MLEVEELAEGVGGGGKEVEVLAVGAQAVEAWEGVDRVEEVWEGALWIRRRCGRRVDWVEEVWEAVDWVEEVWEAVALEVEELAEGELAAAAWEAEALAVGAQAVEA